jgi:hypothetical protein
MRAKRRHRGRRRWLRAFERELKKLIPARAAKIDWEWPFDTSGGQTAGRPAQLPPRLPALSAGAGAPLPQADDRF